MAGYAQARAEVKYGERSRVDFLLSSPGEDTRPPAWVEVKSVTLSRQGGLAEWPDSVSSRSVQHLRELTARIEAGDRAVLLFVTQRGDCDRFAPAADLDPAFAKALGEAQAAGLEVLVYACRVSPEEIAVSHRLGERLG